MFCVLRNFNKFINANPNINQLSKQISLQQRNIRGLRRVQDNGNKFKTEPTESNQYSSDKECRPEKKNNSDAKVSLDFANREVHVPTFNLAAYVKHSITLQQLLSIGVDLHQIERRKGIGQFVLRLDFEQNVKPYLRFLADQGVDPECFGKMITKNPLLFKEDLDNLQTRVEYLKSKNFSDVARQRIFTKNPYWLMFSTQRLDKRLGYFQKEFKLSGNDLRLLATKEPRLITYKMDNIRQSIFTMREEMGFSNDDLKSLVLQRPRLMMIPPDDLIERFDYAHNTMKLSHAQLLQCPEVLESREFRIRERHEFLKLLGRAQYDPLKDLYVSPSAIVQGNNFHFVRNVAKTDMQTFDLFLKTR